MTRRHFIRLTLALGAPLFLLPVSSAVGYTFTQVTGSPFSAPAGCIPLATCADRVALSPGGKVLAAVSPSGVLLEKVSTSGVVIRQVGARGVGPSTRHRGQVLQYFGVSSFAFSPGGALAAVVATPGFSYKAGSLWVFKVKGMSLMDGLCRDLPYTGKNPTREGYYAVAWGPNRTLAVTNVGKDTVAVYSVTKAGKPYPVSGSPFGTGKDPDAVASGPTRSGGEVMAVANWGDNTVSSYSVSGGAFPPAAGSPFTALAGPSSLAFSPTGGLLAVADSGGRSVNMYTVGYTGALTGVAAAYTGDAPTSVGLGDKTSVYSYK